LEFAAADPASVLTRLAGIRSGLTGPGGIDPGRFLDDLAKANGTGAPRASLKLVLLPPP
jgi:hypothetical protein